MSHYKINRLLFFLLLMILLSACESLNKQTIPDTRPDSQESDSTSTTVPYNPKLDGYEKFIVRFIDSQTGNPVYGANVVFEKKGKEVRAITDSNGFVIIRSFPFSENDDKKGLIKYKVVANGYSILKDKSPCFQKEIALSKTITKVGKYRVVISWGKNPLDIDSHLWFKNNHVYYAHMKGIRPNMFADLDRDDTNSYGPETTTIHKFFPDENYLFAVHDYTNKDSNSSKKLSYSDARVHVYSHISNEPIKTFYIPKNRRGTIWYVFYFNKNREIVEINKFGYKSKGGDRFPIDYIR